MSSKESQPFATWIEINARALAHNFSLLKKIAGDSSGVIAVIKANAYGHGALEVARILSKEGAEVLGVNNVQEAFELRQGGIRVPILIMGYIAPQDLPRVIDAKFDFLVFDEGQINVLEESLRHTKVAARVHIKFDSGMGRLGIPVEKFEKVLVRLREHKKIKLVGVASHFACADINHDLNALQTKSIVAIMDILKKNSMKIPMLHFSNSAMSVRKNTKTFTQQNIGKVFIRPGLLLYGMSPFAQKIKMIEKFKPVLSWKARVVQIKEFSAGHCISYGCTYRTHQHERIAVLPVGYYEGLDRKMSNMGEVLIRGRRAKIRGRVCMDFVMVDISHIPGVRVGDEAVLIGKSGKDVLDADDMAHTIHTINYEITTRLNCKIPRIIV